MTIKKLKSDGKIVCTKIMKEMAKKTEDYELLTKAVSEVSQLIEKS